MYLIFVLRFSPTAFINTTVFDSIRTNSNLPLICLEYSQRVRVKTFRKGTIHQQVVATFETEGLQITFESYQSETDEITGTAWIHQADRSYLGDAKLWYKQHEGSAQIKLFIQEFQE